MSISGFVVRNVVRGGGAVGLSAGLLGLFGASLAHAADAPPPYKIDIVAAPAQKGKAATATVKIIAATSYHMNKDFPTSLTLTPPAGVTVEKPKLTGGDVKLDEHAAVFTVSYTPAEAGKKEIPGDLKFAVCTVDACFPQKAKIGIPTTTK